MNTTQTVDMVRAPYGDEIDVAGTVRRMERRQADQDRRQQQTASDFTRRLADTDRRA
jgi:hypothetical protein